jgi:hypothetical protein
VFQQAHNCAQCFAGLVELTKKHKTRNQLLGTALKNGGAFIDVMVKATDFWYAYYLANGRPFQQLVKTVQKGTKTMQVRLCFLVWLTGGTSEAVGRRQPNAQFWGVYWSGWQGQKLFAASATSHSTSKQCGCGCRATSADNPATFPRCQACPVLQLCCSVLPSACVTVLLQAICAEGKVRGGASVVAQAPTAKRALERFVHEMHSLFLQAGEPPEAITVGFLKHRDIEGNTMPSQVRQLACQKKLAEETPLQGYRQGAQWCCACLLAG